MPFIKKSRPVIFSPQLVCMNNIFSISTPLKVLHSIIPFFTIQMVYLGLLFGIQNKGFGDQNMNKNTRSPSPKGSQVHSKIPFLHPFKVHPTTWFFKNNAWTYFPLFRITPNMSIRRDCKLSFPSIYILHNKIATRLRQVAILLPTAIRYSLNISCKI